VKEVGGDAAAGGDVFGIGDDEIDLAVAHQALEFLLHHLSTRTADDVSQTQDADWQGGSISAGGSGQKSTRAKIARERENI
jgi:hypothetical protein